MRSPFTMNSARPQWIRLAVLLATLSVALVPRAAVALSDDVASEGVLTSVRGCEVRYRVHRASSPESGLVVVIAHGFMRKGTFMSGWADAIAREGTSAVTVDMCASLQPEGRAADNGIDLVALRGALRADRVVYIGVSAGGLAALVAASIDTEATRGVLLLDPVDTGAPLLSTTGNAKSAASQVRAPVAALISKPQVCNAWRNIDPALEELAQATIIRVDGASHCDFEWPTDAFCRVACVSTSGGERRRRSETRIRELGLSFVRAIGADDSDALYRWKGDIGAILN